MKRDDRLLTATLIAGTLDIAFAAIDTGARGRDVLAMLRGVAAGPFPAALQWGQAGAALGLLVHFVLMLVIAAMFITAYGRSVAVRTRPIGAGILYGLGVWLVMYGLVLRMRFGVPFPNPSQIELAKQLFAHIGLVGVPIALVARR